MYIHTSIDTNMSVFFLKCSPLPTTPPHPLPSSPHQERRLPPPVPKKPPKGPHHHPPLARDRSLESSEKQRQEARKRLMAAKRAASVRQNSATESADSIEIYIPEAQTRLWGHYQGHTQGWHAAHTQTHMPYTTQKRMVVHTTVQCMGVTNIWIHYFDMHRSWSLNRFNKIFSEVFEVIIHKHSVHITIKGSCP